MSCLCTAGCSPVRSLRVSVRTQSIINSSDGRSAHLRSMAAPTATATTTGAAFASADLHDATQLPAMSKRPNADVEAAAASATPVVVAGEKKQKTGTSSGTVLLLGCGLVAPPLIQYLSSHGVHVIVASRTLAKTQGVIKGLAGVTAVEWDIEQKDALAALDALTQKADIVCSLLPYTRHVAAAEIAIKHKKHFTTTSYVSDAMAALGPAADAAGVCLLNEMGVDPGLDFMSAQKIIDEVHAKKGEVVGFYSVCGGLPAPQHNTNPFGYKLSWSPRGVLMASRNNATYLVNGQKVDVKGEDLYKRGVYHTEQIAPLGRYEWYANRDSLKYIKEFSIPEVQTIIRGTYRNVGWCDTMRVIATSGLTSMDDDSKVAGKTYADFMRYVFKLPAGSADTIKADVAAKLGLTVGDATIAKFEWLGLFSSTVTVPAKVTTALDAVCHLMESKMQYADGEKDMILMKHIFEVRYSNTKRETITSTLIDFGQQPQGHSSMSRTVSLPVAVAMRAMLDGRLKLKGLVRPFRKDLYTLVLDEMATLGVVFKEQRLGEHLWLRHEVKPGEERVAVVPQAAADLIKAGYRISVERSPTRCIDDAEYEKVGCELVPTGSWPTAPSTAIIVGLKELPESNAPLLHRHVFFAHAFKNQSGWKELLQRFDTGRGMVWDLEFLNDASGRRVAAFGRPAGVAGMAVGLLTWAQQQLHPKEALPALKSWKSTPLMVAEVKAALAKAVPLSAKKQLPTVMVLGALGRCGGGAVWFAEQCGIAQITKWDIAETKAGGPFPTLVQSDVLVNAIYLDKPIPPFVTDAMVDGSGRVLSVFVDVSCDTTNPHNPFPIYKETTLLTKPTLRVRGAGAADAKQQQQPVLDVVAIDHLPSLVPFDSSVGFCTDLMPTLRNIASAATDPVWLGAEKWFNDKVAAAKAK